MTFESINEVVVKWKNDIDNAILGEIKHKAIDNGIKTEYVLNEKAIISALKKQIPKKPDYEADGYADGVLCCDYAKCPVCGHDFEEGINDWGCGYCSDCGQALDWSDTE